MLNSNDTPNGQESLTSAMSHLLADRSLRQQRAGHLVAPYVNFNGTSYRTTTAAFGTWGSNYVETTTPTIPWPPESTITPAGAVSFTVYTAWGRRATSGRRHDGHFVQRQKRRHRRLPRLGRRLADPQLAHLQRKWGEPLRHLVKCLQRRWRGHGHDGLRRRNSAHNRVISFGYD